jgi:hypothetical protein
MSSPFVDDVKLKRGLLSLVMFVAAVMGGFLAIRHRQLFIRFLILLFPLACWMVANPHSILMAAIFTHLARLRVPGLPAALLLTHVFQAVTFGWWFMYMALRRPHNSKWDTPTWSLFLFLLVIIAHMFLRGAGMRVMGGGTFGGARYIHLYTLFAFYFAAPAIRLTESQIRKLFWVMAIGSLVPALAQISYVVFPGQTYFLYDYIQGSGLGEDIMEGASLTEARLTRISPLGYVLLMVGLIYPFRTRLWSVIFIITAIFIVSLSGFRSRLLQVAAILGMFSLFYSRNRFSTTCKWAVVGICVWLTAIVIAPILPAGIQRALSFLPFVKVQVEIATQAAGTVEWRLDLWRLCQQNVREYFLLGRGMAVDVTEFAWLGRGIYSSKEFFYHMQNYHNGFYSFILDFGILGFIFGTTFLVSAAVAAGRGLKYCKVRRDMLARFYVYTAMYHIYMVFAYFVIYGSVRNSFPAIIMNLVMMRIVGDQLAREAHQGMAHNNQPQAAEV